MWWQQKDNDNIRCSSRILHKAIAAPKWCRTLSCSLYYVLYSIAVQYIVLQHNSLRTQKQKSDAALVLMARQSVWLMHSLYSATAYRSPIWWGNINFIHLLWQLQWKGPASSPCWHFPRLLARNNFICHRATHKGACKIFVVPHALTFGGTTCPTPFKLRTVGSATGKMGKSPVANFFQSRPNTESDDKTAQASLLHLSSYIQRSVLSGVQFELTTAHYGGWNISQ